MGYANRGIRKFGDERKSVLVRRPTAEKLGRCQLYLQVISKKGFDLDYLGVTKHCFARVIKKANTVRMWKERQVVIIDKFDYPEKTVTDKSGNKIKCIVVREADVMGIVPTKYWKARQGGAKL